MHYVSDSAQKVLEKLFENVEPGGVKKIGENEGAIMQVVCERPSRNSYSVAHYFKMNGDTIADPDVEFRRDSDGRFFPLAIQQTTGYTTAIVQTRATGPTINAPVQQDIAEFCTIWMENIRQQQGL